MGGGFHRYLNPESLFYPTASQVVAHARAGARADQSLVIIGGNSIMFGSGQGADELWGDALQQALGDQFRVVNLAFPSGTPGEHGSVAAQALTMEGRDLVFVVQVYPDVGTPDGNMYRYVVYDALAHGLLLPSAERDRLLSQSSPFDDVRSELRIRSRLDSALYFTDLWQTIGVHAAFTSWQPFVAPGLSWWSPRSAVPDQQPGAFPPQLRYPPQAEAPTMAGLERETASFCEQSEAFWPYIRDTIAAQIPEGLRARTLVLLTARSKHFTSRPPVDQQQCRDESLRRMTAHFSDEGYDAMAIGLDWTEDDFVDLVHPSGSGGRKLAAEIAPAVRMLAGR